MADLRRFVSDHKVGVSLVTAGILVVGGVIGGVAVAGSPDEGSATVTAVVDGDTIDVELGGKEQRVRLLNVDTPEVDGCLHEEATAFLAERIPPGTEVELELDEEHHDQYDRLLAGVVEGGQLVNAEIARQGLGVAVLIEPNDRFYDDVLSAQEEAEADGLGLFSQDVACTLPAQVGAYAGQVEDLEARVAAVVTIEQADGWAAEAATVATVGSALAAIFDGDEGHFPLLAHTGDRSSLQRDAEDADARLAAAQEQVDEVRRAEEQRLQEEQERQEQEERDRAEAERLAQEEAERLAREEADRQAREQAEREEAERRAAEESTQQEPSGSAYYENCAAARAAGAAPVLVGQPGYGRHLDRDGDGIGCES
ncbi:hypothetical protein FE251_06240 [Georgenia wutianyii]|uniref:TNase-like domain-containing protein n=1 Tax=Georgenia wutianyii TaxID=2585135 RepID=A0ABX5VKQ3_9MICO|nr:excalibur calcium-binding domain-containing protein [Georgenia wutianyii]QDB79014.1 hypothetical protein FE251_06240 [Georgenia wutianyii]